MREKYVLPPVSADVKLYVERLPDGRYKYRLPYIDHRTGKLRRISTTKASGSKQAYSQALRELQMRAISDVEHSYTLREAAELYLKDKARTVRQQSLNVNTIALTVIHRELDENTFLDQLNAFTLRQALLRISEKNSTYNERLKRYKAFLNWCWQNGIIETDWYKKMIPLPDSRKDRIAEKFLEPDEMQRLLDVMTVPMWYYLTYFMTLSGLRIGESIALELSDVTDYININKNYRLNLHDVEQVTKTSESRRMVFIQQELRELIDRYIIFRTQYLNKHGVTSTHFFCDVDGNYIKYVSYNEYLKKASKEAIGRPITAHALRHTSASFLIANNVPLDAISRRLGHSDSVITKEIYIHKTNRLKELDNQLVDSVKFL